jgi:chromatin structure-remodeling complex subunit RSC1/2
MYNALTSLHEARELPQGVPPASPVAFASLPAGPGNAKPMSDNGTRGSDPREFTGSRVSTKDRVFTSMAKYKGMAYKMGAFPACFRGASG